VKRAPDVLMTYLFLVWPGDVAGGGGGGFFLGGRGGPSPCREPPGWLIESLDPGGMVDAPFAEDVLEWCTAKEMKYNDSTNSQQLSGKNC
jgi:hypothetical protein